MKRSMCGLVVLAAATSLWSCNGDPTGDIRGAERVVADPASIFVDEGGSEFVTVEVLDEQGNRLASSFEAQNVGSGITVEKDTTFLSTTIGTHLETSSRFVVSGLTPASTTFELVSGEHSITIPVRVLPGSFAATLSNAAPAQNEAVTLTAPAGYTFGADAEVTVGADEAVVVSRAPDGTSLAFVPKPGLEASRNVVTVSGAHSDLFSSVPLDIPTVDSITIPVVASLPGTASPGTAPVLSAPAPGITTALFDKGSFTGPDIGFEATGLQWYQVPVAEAGDYGFSVDWDGTSDIDAFLCIDTGCSGGSLIGSGTAHPEAGILTLAVQTYYLALLSYHTDTLGIPPRVILTVNRAE